MPDKTFVFGEFRVNISQGDLRKGSESIPIQPKVFEVLRFFLENPNQLASRDELMNAVWGETFVEETNIRFCIHSLRKVIGEDYIETLPKRGYKFNGEVRVEQIDHQPLSLSGSGSLSDTAETRAGSSENLKVRKVAFSALALMSVLLLAGVVWSTWKQPPSKTSVAVLPFIKLGDRPESRVETADAIITQLSKLKEFRVYPVSAIQKYASDADPQTAGRALGADSVISGSFREENGTIRVSANLLKIESGETIWSETFSVKPDSNPEEQIAARLARLFSLKFVEFEDERSARTHKVNPEALEAYLSARKIWHSRDLGRSDEMRSLIQKAVELEPKWAAARSAKAEALIFDDLNGKFFQEAEHEANAAIELDPKQTGALTVLGHTAFHRDWNPDKAEPLLRKALELNPNYAAAANEYGILLAEKRNFVESERWIKKALEIEPFSPLYNTSLCRTYYFDKRIDKAIEQCKFALSIEPGYWLARKNLFWAYVYKGQNDKVAELILEPHRLEVRSTLPYVEALNKGDLGDYWKDYFVKNAKNPIPYTDALAHMQTGDKQRALSSLERNLEDRNSSYPSFNADPIFDPLRREPRFIAIAEKLAGFAK